MDNHRGGRVGIQLEPECQLLNKGLAATRGNTTHMGKEADTSGAGARQPGEAVSRKRIPGTNSPCKGHRTQAAAVIGMVTHAHRFRLPPPQFGAVTGRWLPQTGLRFPAPLASWDHMTTRYLTARDLKKCIEFSTSLSVTRWEKGLREADE